MDVNKSGQVFHPTLCVTHGCNLDCTYCYQKHDSTAKMSIDTAIAVINHIFDNIPDNTSHVEIDFIGGEPLLEFGLLKEIVAYTCSQKTGYKCIFFASTNGTILSEEMREWFTSHKDQFVLGLSLDGTRETHNRNRCNSYDDIDMDFFLKNWPDQGIKMTLSEYSLSRLAKDIKHIHSLGFKSINGVNLAEGVFNWDNEEYIKMLVPQLKELVEFYADNEAVKLNNMFDKRLNLCETKERGARKWCGIGTGCLFFDIDGKMYPCAFTSPMTFKESDLVDILNTDFAKDNNFIDKDCYNHCYIYTICPTCAGASYLINKTFQKRDKSRCKIQKLIALFIADLQAKRIEKNPQIYDNYTLYHTIEAIKKIRILYLPEFDKYLI